MSAETTRAVALRYQRESAVREAGGGGARVALALDASRGAVGLRGVVKDAALLRDALMTAAGVHASDLRFKQRDRSAYLAHLARQGQRASASVWEAQKAYLAQMLSADTRRDATLPPLLTVHPDEVALEVFSADESAWARLSLDSALFAQREAAHGDAFVDLSPDLLARLDRLRAWAPVTLDASTEPMGDPSAARAAELAVPWRWLRGYVQVQSAAVLPAATCELRPVDLYNILYVLRSRRAKTSPRALRFELVPGRAPRVILEPWEIQLEGHGPAYGGGAPRVIRTFGRQRLLGLARVLPHVQRVTVHLLGPGLPVFWVLDLGPASLTVALSGWTEAGWSGASTYDALTPAQDANSLADALHKQLVAQGPMRLDALVRASRAEPAAARAAMQREALRGRAVYDLARGVWRPRNLLDAPLDDAAVRFGNEREALAHKLLGDGKAKPAGEVKLTKVHELVGEGIELVGEVTDRDARRSYAPSFRLDLEGRATDASCSCALFRRAGMREGPCEHLLALRIAYVRRRAEEERLRATPEGRRLIRAETRTFVRRDAAGRETVYRVSLDEKVVRVRWGGRADEGRNQSLWFDSDRDAREAYFSRIEALAAEGYIDAEMAFA